ncbi:winged helix-turn-helix transcriptional regulator [Streptomyces spinoverrucosus]|uniref:GntR family transcriptional regulator n=1 Tax=Streptomyces spinoverrucosus TaxID=284043 RepID=UPI0018C36B7B|nr:winged helix-turn-helix domain-containing protein [Streptomyces spinoverrucosus]MBG0854623.1 winged helix-turn-helix transcriptional regulator [Streptomyces spinoverrucosus]
MTVSQDDPRSAYEQVADDLRKKIASGVLRAGQKLDGNAKMAEHYGVAAMTIRHALDILRGERLIVSQQGRGTFVASDPVGTDSAERDANMADELSEIKAALELINSRLDRLEDRVHERP